MAGSLEVLINEVRVFYQSLVQMGESIHAGSNISLGMRAVLEYLDINGDTTVPDIARSRRVTRQRIQTLANALLAEKLVESIDNPASKRSPLITLTEAGSDMIKNMRRREGTAFTTGVSDKQINDALKTLRSVRKSFEANRLK